MVHVHVLRRFRDGAEHHGASALNRDISFRSVGRRGQDLLHHAVLRLSGSLSMGGGRAARQPGSGHRGRACVQACRMKTLNSARPKQQSA